MPCLRNVSKLLVHQLVGLIHAQDMEAADSSPYHPLGWVRSFSRFGNLTRYLMKYSLKLDIIFELTAFLALIFPSCRPSSDGEGDPLTHWQIPSKQSWRRLLTHLLGLDSDSDGGRGDG